MRSSFGKSGQKGFTLIEIMAAFTIIAIMVTIVYSILYVSRKTQKSHEKKLRRYSMIRRGLDELNRDLSMAFLSLSENELAPEKRTYFKAHTDIGGTSLQFSTFSHVRTGRGSKEGDSCAVKYSLIDDPDDAGKFLLIRYETHRLENKIIEDIPGETWGLIPGVISLNMEFYDAKNDEWSEEWDTTSVDGKINKLPSQIKIHLLVDNGTGYPVNFYDYVTPKLVDAINIFPSGSASGNYMNINSKNKSRSSGISTQNSGNITRSIK